MKINEQTVFSFTVVGALMGIASYATSWSKQTEANSKEIAEVREEMKELRQMKVDFRTDMAVVQTDLKRVLRKLGE